MNIAKTKSIKIEDYLAHIGQVPIRKLKGGMELRFKAYYRNDSTPSLDINTNKNIWIDRGEGIGGDLVDLIKREKMCDTSSALNHLDNIFSFSPAKRKNLIDKKEIQSSQEIISITNLSDKKLIAYASSRGIDKEILIEETMEITYKNSKGKFKALGFENIEGGWDLRSKYYKGKIGKSSYSKRNPNEKSVIVVEGFFDYLSILELSEKPYSYSYLILNSITNLNLALKELSKYEFIYLSLDNDKAGEKVTKEIIKIMKNTKDMRVKYEEFKDLNEYLINK